MTNITKISPAQTIIFLFISRAITAITYTPINANLNNTSRLIGCIISILLSIIVLIPSFFLVRNNGDNVINVIHGQKNTLRNILSIIYAIYFLWVCITSILTLEYFITTAVFPNSKSTLIIVLFLIAVAYCVFMGIEGVMRTSSILFVLLLISMGFIIISSSQNVNLLYFKPLSSQSSSDLFSSIAEFFTTNSEIVLLLIICKFNKDNKQNKENQNNKAEFKKTAILSVAFGGLILLSVLLLSTLILGEFISTQLFPFYTISSISEIGFLQRLDAIHMALWVLISLIKVSVFLLVADELVKSTFPQKARPFSMGILLIALLIICLTFGVRLNYNNFIDYNLYGSVFIILLALVIPLIILISKKAVKKEGPKFEK